MFKKNKDKSNKVRKDLKIELNFEDLKKLNYKTIYAWPAVPKAAVLSLICFATVICGYLTYINTKIDELTVAERKETSLKEEFIASKKQAINLSTYENQLVEIENTFGTLLKQLPNKSEMESLVTDINQAGLSKNLKFELFRPAAAEKTEDFYAELPISIKVTGTYNDIGGFASEVSSLSRVVVLTDVTMSSVKPDTVTMEAKAKTYRYLDEEEIEKQRQEKLEAEKKKRKPAPKAAEKPAPAAK